MLTAMMAVWNMEGASYDIWSVNTDFEYLEKLKLDEDRPDYQKKSVIESNSSRRDGEEAEDPDDGAPDRGTRPDGSGGRAKVSAGR